MSSIIGIHGASPEVQQIAEAVCELTSRMDTARAEKTYIMAMQLLSGQLSMEGKSFCDSCRLAELGMEEYMCCGCRRAHETA